MKNIITGIIVIAIAIGSYWLGTNHVIMNANITEDNGVYLMEIDGNVHVYTEE